MLGALAAVVRKDGNERQVLVGAVDDAARGRTHVPAFVGPILLRTLHRVLLGGGAKRGEALAFRTFGIVHASSPMSGAVQLDALADGGVESLVLSGRLLLPLLLGAIDAHAFQLVSQRGASHSHMRLSGWVSRVIRVSNVSTRARPSSLWIARRSGWPSSASWRVLRKAMTGPGSAKWRQAARITSLCRRD